MLLFAGVIRFLVRVGSRARASPRIGPPESEEKVVWVRVRYSGVEPEHRPESRRGGTALSDQGGSEFPAEQGWGTRRTGFLSGIGSRAFSGLIGVICVGIL